MKRICLLVTFVLLLVLAACGGQADTGQAPVSEVDLSNLPESVDVATTASLQGRDDVLLIDVREQWEYDEGHIPGITHIPMGEIPHRLQEIPTDKTVVVTCRSGNRSSQVTDFLRQQGYDNIHNMAGGILAWQQAGYEVER